MKQIRRKVKKVKRESWQNYIHDIGNYLHGRKEKAYRILKDLNRSKKDKLQTRKIMVKLYLRIVAEKSKRMKKAL